MRSESEGDLGTGAAGGGDLGTGAAGAGDPSTEAAGAGDPSTEAAGAGDPSTEAVEWRNPFSGPVELAVDQRCPGPVVVKGWDRAEVEVWAVKTVRCYRDPDRARSLLREVEVEIGAREDRVEVAARSRRSHWNLWGPEHVSVALNVFVPRGSEVDVDAGSGRVEVHETLGPVGVDTGSGSVHVTRAAGEVTVDAGSGSVTVEEIRGDVGVEVGSGAVAVARVKGDVEVDGTSGSVSLTEIEGSVEVDASSGAVRLGRIIGNVSVDTGSGSVALTAVRGRHVSVDTGSGGVEADIDVLPNGRYHFDTGSGRIVLTVPEDASFAISVTTGSGSIRCEVPLVTTRSGRDSLEGRMGDGSAVIHAETSSGGFVLRSRPRATGRENRETILRMIAEKKLTAEQGHALLEALESPDPRGAPAPPLEDRPTLRRN